MMKILGSNWKNGAGSDFVIVPFYEEYILRPHADDSRTNCKYKDVNSSPSSPINNICNGSTPNSLLNNDIIRICNTTIHNQELTCEITLNPYYHGGIK